VYETPPFLIHAPIDPGIAGDRGGKVPTNQASPWLLECGYGVLRWCGGEPQLRRTSCWFSFEADWLPRSEVAVLLFDGARTAPTVTSSLPSKLSSTQVTKEVHLIVQIFHRWK